MPEVELPDGAVVLNTLHLIEYLDANDNQIYKVDLSMGPDGQDVDWGKMLELIEWARAFTISDLIADMVHDYVHGEQDDDDEDEEEAPV